MVRVGGEVLGAAWATWRGEHTDTDVGFPTVLAAARDGAPWALRRIYEELGPGVLGYCRSRRPQDADAVASEVFVRVFRSVDAFRGSPEGFRAWVFTVARNLVVDDHRRGRRRVALVDLTDRAHQVVGGDAEEDALQRLQRAEVDRILACLTDEQREVVMLRVVADLSVEEVAVTTGRSPAAVRAMQHRAVATIRRTLPALAG